ncbi:MAG: ComEC/Rec2 family competence protein [Flavobacteriales bacterium]|nr:ComEC/Rec2 family competence protein [Flavobacteriales bacterium]
MLRIGAAFVLGVVVGLTFELPLLPVALVASVVTLVMGRWMFRSMYAEWHWTRGGVFYAWVFLFALCWTILRTSSFVPGHIDQAEHDQGPWLLRVSTVNGASAKAQRAEADVVAQWNGKAMEGRSGQLMLTLLRDSTDTLLRNGDLVMVDANVERIARVPDPGGFDRERWAASRGVHHELLAGEGRWRMVGHEARWTDLFSELRNSISTWLNGSELAVRERALVKALVLGMRDELDGEQREDFMRSGTIHVLAVSGMHVGLIYAVLTFLATGVGATKRAKLLTGVLVLMALWGYAGLTGASPSVLRATIMFTLYTVSNMATQRTDHLNSLFVAAVGLLLWDPVVLLNAGFQLSFLAVLGIILFYKPFEDLWTPPTWFLHKVWSLALVSISAQLLTGPLSLYLFKAFPLWFLPANIMVVAAVGFAVYGGVALILLYKLPLIGTVLTLGMSALLWSVGALSSFFAELPGAYPSVRVDAFQAVLLYLLIFTVGAWRVWHWRRMREATVVVTCVLGISWMLKAEELNARTQFVVYDAPRGLQAGLLQGRDLLVLDADDDRYLDRMGRHARYAGAWRTSIVERTGLFDDTPTVHGASVMARGRWLAPRMDIGFYTGDTTFLHRRADERFDAVVVSGTRFVSDDHMDRLVSMADHVVLAGDLRWKLRSRFVDICAERGVPCHDVREHGAFILER